MSQELRDLMVRAAETVPAVRVDENLWRDARAAGRRRLLVAPLAAAVIVLGVLGAVWQGSSLLSGAREVGPVTGEARPAVPSHVYAIPAHVVGVSGRKPWPLGGDDSLAVGIGAVALAVRTDGVAVISATDGAYHLLDLPGMAEGGTYRLKDGVIGLSPDGRQLAYTWNESSFASPDKVYAPSGVRILDLTTGKISSHRVRACYGVFAHGFSWSPEGRYLAYNLDVANVSQSHVRGRRNFSVERLDTRTGERLEAAGVPNALQPPAVTDRGTVVTGMGTTLWTWQPGRGTRVVDLARSNRWRGSVVSLGSLAGSDRVVVSAGLEYSRLYSGLPERPGSFRRISAGAPRLSLVGAVGGSELAVLEQTDAGTTLWTVRASGPRLNDRSSDLMQFDDLGGQYTLATALLRRPPRDFPKPSWPWSIEQKLLLAGAALAAVAALGAVAWRRTRRRGRRPSLRTRPPGDAARTSSDGDATR